MRVNGQADHSRCEHVLYVHPDPLTDSTIIILNLTYLGIFILEYVVCVIFSIYMFTSTALRIRRQTKEIARAVNDVDRNRGEDENKKR